MLILVLGKRKIPRKFVHFSYGGNRNIPPKSKTIVVFDGLV
jgi:hypothetical protein